MSGGVHADASVQLPTDGTGKYVRNVSALVWDEVLGAYVTKYVQVTGQLDPDTGNLLPLAELFSTSAAERRTTNTLLRALVKILLSTIDDAELSAEELDAISHTET